MNKEFRDWLERELQLFKTANHLETVDGLGMREVLEFVIKEYDELHKPVVIPKHVADWIEKYTEYGYDLYPALNKMENNSRTWKRIYKWYRMNTHEFVNAYLTGEYDIEEPKYNVRVPHTPQVYYRKELFDSSISTVLTKEDDESIIFTEQEIKEQLPDIPKKYWEEVE